MTTATLETAVGFDYDLLPDEHRLFVQQKALRIRTHSRQATQRLAAIGQELLAVKARIGHGLFRAWARAEFGWDNSYTTRLMQMAEAFGDLTTEPALASTTALSLLSQKNVPEAAREAAREVIRSGEPLTLPRAREILEPHAPDVARRHETARQSQVRIIAHEREQLERKTAKIETLAEQIRNAVRNLQVALTNAYGVPIQPREVRDAFDRLQRLVEQSDGAL